MVRSNLGMTTLIVLSAVLFVGPSWAGEGPTADQDLAAWLDRRIQEWQPTAAEKRFDEIGWASDIREALRLGREHNRPIFLFTHDGHLNVGRC